MVILSIYPRLSKNVISQQHGDKNLRKIIISLTLSNLYFCTQDCLLEIQSLTYSIMVIVVECEESF